MRLFVLSLLFAILSHSFISVNTHTEAPPPTLLYRNIIELSEIVRNISEIIPSLQDRELGRCTGNVARLTRTGDMLENQADRCNTREADYEEYTLNITEKLESTKPADFFVTVNESPEADRIVMDVHPEVRECIRSFDGEPIELISAQTGLLGAFARIHASAGRPAHGGPGFLPWHRAFLALYEEALRLYDPTVALPYWDFTIEDGLQNPVSSMLWTTDFVGDGAGEVLSGAFQHTTPQGRLVRLIGRISRLVSRAEIEALMNRCSLENISKPMTRSLEMLHDFVHSWIGGNMGFVNTAAYDPIFYMLHCYIDYVWERFRLTQSRPECNRDPTTDFPTGALRTGHHLNDSMFGMPYFEVGDGLAALWTQNWYVYEDSPTCGDCCNSLNLRCDHNQSMCLPHVRVHLETEEQIQESIDMIQHEIELEDGAMPFHTEGAFAVGESDGRNLQAVLDAIELFREEHGHHEESTAATDGL